MFASAFPLKHSQEQFLRSSNDVIYGHQAKKYEPKKIYWAEWNFWAKQKQKRELCEVKANKKASEINQKIWSNYKGNCLQQKIYDGGNEPKKKHLQTGKKPAIFLKLNTSNLKKKILSDSKPGLWLSRLICYLQAKCARDAKIFKNILNWNQTPFLFLTILWTRLFTGKKSSTKV